MDKSSVEPTIFFIEKISFSLKLFSGHFYGQSFIKTVRGPLTKLRLQTNGQLVTIRVLGIDKCQVECTGVLYYSVLGIALKIKGKQRSSVDVSINL